MNRAEALRALVENSCRANGYPLPICEYGEVVCAFEWNNWGPRIEINIWYPDATGVIVVEYENFICDDDREWKAYSYEELEVLLQRHVLPLLFI